MSEGWLCHHHQIISSGYPTVKPIIIYLYLPDVQGMNSKRNLWEITVHLLLNNINSDFVKRLKMIKISTKWDKYLGFLFFSFSNSCVNYPLWCNQETLTGQTSSSLFYRWENWGAGTSSWVPQWVEHTVGVRSWILGLHLVPTPAMTDHQKFIIWTLPEPRCQKCMTYF